MTSLRSRDGSPVYERLQSFMSRPHLVGGDDYRCRFGGAPAGNETRATVATAGAVGVVVVATHDAALGTLACVAPPAVPGPGEVRLEVLPVHCICIYTV